METRKLKMICTKSKLGHSLSQISELTALTMDQVKQRLGQATGLSPEVLSNIFDMKQRGLSLELISQESEVELDVLKQFLPQVIKKTVETHALAEQGQGQYEISLGERAYTLGSPDHCKTYSRSHPKTTKKTKQPPQPTKTLPNPQHTPTFLYCCKEQTNQLHRVNLLTGEQSCHEVPITGFRYGCRWSELPGGSLLITGGYPGGSEVVKIDTLREYAVSSQPPMHTGRRYHASVYNSQYLYVLGGNIEGRYLKMCERYSCAESRWDVLPALPVGGYDISTVVINNSLYALGGRTTTERGLDTVQKLSLDSLTWELMQLKLPQAALSCPCFKTDTKAYLVIGDILFSFNLVQFKPIKSLPFPLYCSSSYFSRGTLYSATSWRVKSVVIGKLA
jgi:hypothetical protein